MASTVLLIDDNEHEREILARFLTFVGGSVLEASNGEEGLRLARTQLPSLILLDISMPVLDGWGTIRRLKADPLTAWMPVVALTAHHLERERLDRAGFRGYLEKPIVPFRVLEEIEQCIGSLSRGDAERPARSRQDAPATLASGVDALVGRGG